MTVMTPARMTGTNDRDSAGGAEMFRLVRLLIIGIAGGLLVLVALANAHSVELRLDPLGTGQAWLRPIEMPLFLLLFLTLFLGLLIGLALEWWRERIQRRELGQLRAELARQIATRPSVNQ